MWHRIIFTCICTPFTYSCYPIRYTRHPVTSWAQHINMSIRAWVTQNCLDNWQQKRNPRLHKGLKHMPELCETGTWEGRKMRRKDTKHGKWSWQNFKTKILGRDLMLFPETKKLAVASITAENAAHWKSFLPRWADAKSLYGRWRCSSWWTTRRSQNGL